MDSTFTPERSTSSAGGWARYWPWLLKLALLFCLLPFIVLSFFSQPAYDDFGNAARTATYGIWGVQKELYFTWTGRYFSSMLLTLTNPLSYNWPDGMRLTPLLFMGMVWASVALLIRQLLQQLPARRYSAWLGAALLLIYLYAMPDIFQGFFWFTGAIVYQIGNVLYVVALLASYQALLATTPAKRWGWSVVCVLVVGAAAATNEVVLVQLVATFGMCLLASIYQKKRAWRWWILSIVLMLGAALIALAAPGNFVRMAYLNPQNAQSIVYALPRTIFSVLDLLSRTKTLVGLLLILLLWLPLGVRVVKAGHLPFLRMHPLLSIAAICGVLALSYLPFWFIWASYTPERTENAIIFFLLVAWLLAIQAGLGWMHARRIALPELPSWTYGYVVPVFGLLVVLRSASVLAWLDLGINARAFDRALQERQVAIDQQIKAGKQDIVVEPLPIERIFQVLTDGRDLSVDPKAGPNLSIAQYYRVKTIRLARESALSKAGITKF